MSGCVYDVHDTKGNRWHFGVAYCMNGNEFFVHPIQFHHNLKILEITLTIMKIYTAISILFATIANVHAFAPSAQRKTSSSLSMNKSQMIDLVSESANLSKAQAEAAVDGFVNSVTQVSFLLSINCLDPLLCTYSPIIDLYISFSVLFCTSST